MLNPQISVRWAWFDPQDAHLIVNEVKMHVCWYARDWHPCIGVKLLKLPTTFESLHQHGCRSLPHFIHVSCARTPLRATKQPLVDLAVASPVVQHIDSLSDRQLSDRSITRQLLLRHKGAKRVEF